MTNDHIAMHGAAYNIPIHGRSIFDVHSAVSAVVSHKCGIEVLQDLVQLLVGGRELMRLEDAAQFAEYLNVTHIRVLYLT